MNISIFGIIHLKDINILEEMRNILSKKSMEEYSWLFDQPNFNKLRRSIDFQIEINNNREVIVRF